MAQDRRDINMMIAAAIASGLPKDLEMGMDDNVIFVRSQSRVFRIRVEELLQILTEEQARDFMRTLPYGPD